MITIHYDFTDGTEISYVQGKLKKDNFTTHCLDFFNMDEDTDDVIIVRSDGKKISRKNINSHTSKEIHNVHNIHKMFLADSFEWL